MPSSHRRAAAGLTAAAVACSLALAPGAAFGAIVTDPITTSADDAALSLTPLGSFETGVFDEGAAEIVAAYGDRLFVVNAQAATVSVLDYSDPTTITEEFQISGAGVANSVAVRDDGLGVIALEAATKTDPGSLLFFDADAADAGSAILGSVTVGALPDMVTISADGQYAVAANEGEPADDFSIDPEGSISVVALPATVTAPAQGAVATADFREFEEGGSKTLPDGVRVFGPNPAGDLPVSRNLEPEYITVDGATAYVTLQEANSLAVVDLASATVSAIVPLGTKDHGAAGAGLDASDRDGAANGPAVNIDTYPGLNGMYMPDAIDAYTTGGQTYLVTANEGDVREWGEYIDESRVANLATDGYGPVCADSPLASLTGAADLGRLAVSKEDGFNATDGCYEELYSYGARSFSIWNTSGELVWDSGDAFERLTAELVPANFNSDHGASEFDTRSDAKGPEPESVTVGEVDGVPYAFVGLERVGGIMVFDLSSPSEASFVTYLNNRDFAVSGEDATDAAGLAAAGDLGPEGIAFIAAEDSPTGAPLLAVGNEVSGSTTVYSVDATLAATTDVQVLTINDFHGRIEPNFGSGEAGAAVIAGAVSQFESENPNTLFVSSGDMIGASTFTSFIQQDTPTIDALVEAGLDLGAVGNHEFDAGFADLVDRVIPRYGQGDEAAGAPYALGANVYLAGTDEPALQEYVVEDVDGVRVAFIGTVTADTATLVSPAGITEIEFGDQLEAANRVAAEITETDAADVIVLLTHDGAPTEDCATIAQGDSDYAALVNGASAEIDAIVSGHTHQPYVCEVPVNGVAGTERPVIQANQYGTMLGKLDISVDTATGELVSIGGSLVPLVADGAALFPADAEVEAIVADAVEVADELGSVEVGSITGDIVRGGTPPGDDRGVESSLGNLVADMYLWATSNESYAGTPAQIALMNPGGLRADLLFGEDGTVTYRDVANVQPFANTLVTLTLTGAQLEQVLEEQWQPEGSSRPKLHLGVSEGFSYVYDPNAAAGSRILSMTLNGEAIGADDEFTIVTNSFLAAGGDNFFTLAEGTNVADSGQVDLAASVAYFEEFEVVEPAPLGRAVVGETPAPGDGDGGSNPGTGAGNGSGSGSGSGTGSTAGQLGVTGAELPLGAALGAALLLVAGGVLFALRRRTAPAGE